MARILIAGAGATGGALGARLIVAGQDVTFLTRERRAKQLASDGLRFRAPDCDGVHRVRAVTRVQDSEQYDVVIVAVKAPALDDLIPMLTPARGPQTRFVPLLNGMEHMSKLERAFPGQVLGGILRIVATLDPHAIVTQMTELCSLSLGGLAGDAVPETVRRAFDVDGIDLEIVDDVASLLWEKWAFIAAAGVITCLFRGTVGDILAAGGEGEIRQAITECEQIALSSGHPVSDRAHAQSLALLTEPGSMFTSSLYRDLQHGDPAEAEHIIGDLAARAVATNTSAPLLNAALLQLRTHHQSLKRTSGATR
ncbi:2-dehydropantoate 2-reductase [Microbacterium sp. lyk4-40-TSB-66]|uniref:2-dehydropantoate 2-reductase n=1 Tax=Microbacterium sp. lyk4-40-TSB-66 TaxID=3040294 RepID=UPI00254EC92B|nr:2-dehydropantoate 2-reductase [Microbacterium sp. lyk4-40-TSB-66]